MKKILLLGSVAAVILAGCNAKSAPHRGDVYDESKVNQQQYVQNIVITKIMPVQVAIDNDENKDWAKTGGALIGATAGAIIGYNISGHSSVGGAAAGGAIGGVLGGAAGGAMAGNETIVNGVTLVYELDGYQYSSTQVGETCEYRTGNATMVVAGGETRIQPNSSCN